MYGDLMQIFSPILLNPVFIWKSPVGPVWKKRALSAIVLQWSYSCCHAAWLRLPFLALGKKGGSVLYWRTWMGQHCSINMKWDYHQLLFHCFQQSHWNICKIARSSRWEGPLFKIQTTQRAPQVMGFAPNPCGNSITHQGVCMMDLCHWGAIVPSFSFPLTSFSPLFSPYPPPLVWL